MLAALTQLLLCQLIGEVIVRGAGLPLPGPVLGMALMFLLLVVRGGPNHDLKNTAGTLLQHLSLLFVPAGAGVILHLHRVREEWLPISVALVASTFIAMAVTALVLKALLPKPHPETAPEDRT